MEAVCYNWRPELLPLVFLTEGFKTSLVTDLQLYSEFQTATIGGICVHGVMGCM